LSKNSSIKFTTALYYTPNGTSIQARGIDPDIKLNSDIELVDHRNKFKDLNMKEGDLKGHISNPDSAFAKDESEESKTLSEVTSEKIDALLKTDYVFNEALNFLRGMNAIQKNKPNELVK
jgi:carboxyl-terminal processing protease